MKDGTNLGGNQMGPPRRPLVGPLTGANAVPINMSPPRPAAQGPVDNRRGPENVNQVNVGGNDNADPNRQDEYREAHQAYVVFKTEATDMKSLHRRAEVHALV